ncbi:MAG: hypothetical protein JJU02_05265 [Cryomorphaceae bacterium]|nr:hypothetical protein [Cryomorphaceae bacterium]
MKIYRQGRLWQKGSFGADSKFSVHFRSNSELLPELLEKYNIHWPQLLYTTCVSNLEKDFALQGVPYSFLINPEGRIIETNIHFDPEIVIVIREAMKKSTK